MSEESWYKLIAIVIILLFIGGVVYLAVWQPDVSSNYEMPDTRSTTQKQCEASNGVYTTGFFSEGCVFPTKEEK